MKVHSPHRHNIKITLYTDTYVQTQMHFSPCTKNGPTDTHTVYTHSNTHTYTHCYANDVLFCYKQGSSIILVSLLIEIHYTS